MTHDKHVQTKEDLAASHKPLLSRALEIFTLSCNTYHAGTDCHSARHSEDQQDDQASTSATTWNAEDGTHTAVLPAVVLMFC